MGWLTLSWQSWFLGYWLHLVLLLIWDFTIHGCNGLPYHEASEGIRLYNTRRLWLRGSLFNSSTLSKFVRTESELVFITFSGARSEWSPWGWTKVFVRTSSPTLLFHGNPSWRRGGTLVNVMVCHWLGRTLDRPAPRNQVWPISWTSTTTITTRWTMGRFWKFAIDVGLILYYCYLVCNSLPVFPGSWHFSCSFCHRRAL